jgi:hypothetical protein
LERSVPSWTRATTDPFGAARTDSPPPAITVRSKPSRVVALADPAGIQPSMVASTWPLVERPVE